jgi:hypothetical protein
MHAKSAIPVKITPFYFHLFSFRFFHV